MSFYPKLAFSGISKNKRLYLPYILTCTGTVAMYYIICYLSVSPVITGARGGNLISSVMGFGSWVMALFAYLFLIYTNSFLVRRRKKEFGLYNMLGMGKGNIAVILLFETLFTAVISLGLGILLGTVFSKLGEMWILKMTGSPISYGLTFSPFTALMTLAVFAPAFVLLFINSVLRVRFSSAVALIKSENAGEKPPRANYFLGIAGILLLGVAYYLAVVAADPTTALLWFFIAVMLVISGTYLLLISASVMICRILQKCKNYYYKTGHFVTVSSMAYRMKRNGAGLASICILATMVLVMVSTTTCLYFAGEKSLNLSNPEDISISVVLRDEESLYNGQIGKLEAEIASVAEKYNVNEKNIRSWRQISFEALSCGNEFNVISGDAATTQGNTNIYLIRAVPLQDYNRLMNTSETLEDDEIILHMFKADYNEREFITKNKEYKVKHKTDAFISDNNSVTYMMPVMTVVCRDISAFVRTFGIGDTDAGLDSYFSVRWKCAFDTDADGNTQVNFKNELLQKHLRGERSRELGVGSSSVAVRAEVKEEWNSATGSLLFLAILLGTMFTVAMVLIIDYKQISEGYEDYQRFDIMQKVGMTKREIRKSINSQLLTVFFIPLLLAVCHLCFAFPMIQKILLLFGLNDVTLFSVTTAMTVCVFVVLYGTVYKKTSNTYYNIVSGIKKE